MSRTTKIKKNIIASFIIRGSSILISLLLVRILLDILDPTQYGVWITISSLLTWLNFFNIGLGNGLRTRLGEALARNETQVGEILVSTTYAILLIIVSILIVIFIFINKYINWYLILNIDIEISNMVNTLVFIVIIMYLFQLVLKVLNSILLADQRPALSNLFNPLSSFLSLLILHIFINDTSNPLLFVGTIMSSSPIIVLFLASFYFFRNKYRNISPKFSKVNFRYTKELMSLGVQYFFIQVSSLLIFQSANIIISHYFGPSEVTPFNIAYKYFSLIMMLFTIIITPYWSAITEAWTKKDYTWITNSIKHLLKIWIIIVIFALIMFLISPFVFQIWLGEENMSVIIIPLSLKIWLLVYFSTLSFGGIFYMFIHGIGKVRLHSFIIVFGLIIYFPLVFVLIEMFNLGIESLAIAATLSNLFPFIAPIQYYKLIYNKAKGIWNK